MRKGYKVTISINKKKLKPLKKLKKKKVKKNITDENITKGIEIAKKHINKEQEERQERIGKTLVEVHNEILDIEKEKKERLKKRKRLVIFLVMLIICIFIYLFFTYGPIFGIFLFTSESNFDESKVDIVSSEEDIYENYCDELLVYNNRKLTTYNSNSDITWEYTLQEVFTPNIYINGSYMAIANKTNGMIYLFYNKKELLTKRIEGTISNIYVNNNGNFAVEYSSSGYKKVIAVYDKNGELLYNTYLQVSSVIDVKFIDDTKKILVITADTTSFNMTSILNIIDCSINDNNIQEIAKFENSFIYDVIINGKNAIIMLDNKIVNCNLNTYNVNEIKTFDTSQLLFATISNNYYISVEKELEDDEYYINTIRLDNSKISEIKSDNAPKIMKNSGYLNYFVYQDNIQIINKWGVEIKKIEINFPPKEIVIFNKEKCIALIYSNKIYFVNI